MSKIRVLIIEDSEFDARILVSVLRKGGYVPDFKRVETLPDIDRAFKEESWDVILADYNLDNFCAVDALKLLQKTQLDVPFIIISGGIGEDTAVQAMKAGANDYLMKGNLARLVPAVEREIRDAKDRQAKRDAEYALRVSEHRYRLLWETCSDAVVLVDNEGRIHFSNPAVETIFGYRPEDLEGEMFTVLQPESLRKLYSPAIRLVMREGMGKLGWRTTETLGRKKDGEEFPVEIGVGEMTDDHRRWFVGFIRDITKRKQTEQALRENEEQFRLAREIQQRLFPKAPPQIEGFDIAGASRPAEATGGDYYDFIGMLKGRTGFVVGDVTGHGIGPALLMAETRAYLRIVARNREDVGLILSRANRVLAEDMGLERFITLLLICLEPENRQIIYANAGHPPGCILNAEGNLRRKLKRTGVPLGFKTDTNYVASEAIPVEPGDIIIMSTDGIHEAMSEDENFFGMDGMLRVAKENKDLSAEAIVERMYDEVLRFVGPNAELDDLTMVVIKVLK